jgi:hypothetical protein
MLLNNDRLSHWFLGMLLAWAFWVLLLGIPIFHLWLGISIAKIAFTASICCGVQLAVTPWLYSARATVQNADGLVGRRIKAVFIWFSLTTLVLFYYIQRSWPDNAQAHQARIIFSVALPGLLILVGLVLHYNIRSITRISRLFHVRSV